VYKIFRENLMTFMGGTESKLNFFSFIPKTHSSCKYVRVIKEWRVWDGMGSKISIIPFIIIDL
jgi:hypothetical protein